MSYEKFSSVLIVPFFDCIQMCDSQGQHSNRQILLLPPSEVNGTLAIISSLG